MHAVRYVTLIGCVRLNFFDTRAIFVGDRRWVVCTSGVVTGLQDIGGQYTLVDPDSLSSVCSTMGR